MRRCGEAGEGQKRVTQPMKARGAADRPWPAHGEAKTWVVESAICQAWLLHHNVPHRATRRAEGRAARPTLLQCGFQIGPRAASKRGLNFDPDSVQLQRVHRSRFLVLRSTSPLYPCSAKAWATLGLVDRPSMRCPHLFANERMTQMKKGGLSITWSKPGSLCPAVSREQRPKARCA